MKILLSTGGFPEEAKGLGWVGGGWIHHRGTAPSGNWYSMVSGVTVVRGKANYEEKFGGVWCEEDHQQLGMSTRYIWVEHECPVVGKHQLRR